MPYSGAGRLLLACAALAHFAPCRVTGEVYLSVVSDQRSYKPGEPIYLLIDVFNAGGTIRSLPSGCCTYEVTVRGPGIPEPDPNAVKVCSCPNAIQTLAPGRHFRERLLLNAGPDTQNPHASWLTEHYRLTQAGRYTVKLRRTLTDTWLSATTVIHVVPRISHQ